MPVKVDRDLCVGCGACSGVCLTGSLELDDEGKTKVNEDTCIDCGACVASCPVEALSQ